MPQVAAARASSPPPTGGRQRFSGPAAPPQGPPHGGRAATNEDFFFRDQEDFRMTTQLLIRMTTSLPFPLSPHAFLAHRHQNTRLRVRRAWERGEVIYGVGMMEVCCLHATGQSIGPLVTKSGLRNRPLARIASAAVRTGPVVAFGRPGRSSVALGCSGPASLRLPVAAFAAAASPVGTRSKGEISPPPPPIPPSLPPYPSPPGPLIHDIQTVRKCGGWSLECTRMHLVTVM